MILPGTRSLYHRAAMALILSALPLYAQFSVAPVAASMAEPTYPAIAKAAHVSGEVVVHFSIEDDGSTSQVQLVSGPAMLQNAATDAVKRWRFHAPLPINAQHDFAAHLRFKFDNPTPGKEQPDDLEEPLDLPAGGDVVYVAGSNGAVVSEVHSLDGSQTIQSPPAPPQLPACPSDPQPNTPSTGDTPRDFIELEHLPDGPEEADYRVRIFRDGSVEWEGRRNVATLGLSGSRIAPTAAQRIFDILDAGTFWAQCPITLKVAPEDSQGNFISAQVGNISKTVWTAQWRTTGLDKKYSANNLTWAIDKAADTHQWRHGNPALESFANMREDILTPKPGMTLLIRAVLRSWLSAPEDAVEKLIASGVDINEADSSGWTPLMYAVQLDLAGTPELVLLKAHAAVDRRSARGDTALLIAAWRGTLDHDLLAAGADINLANNDGTTPLMMLVERGDPAGLKAALAAGANARAKDRDGRTALEYLNAAACGKPLVPLEPAPPRYEDNGKVVPPPPPPPCPSTDPTALEDQKILLNAMQAGLTR